MHSKSKVLTIFVVLFALVFIQGIYYYPKLPDKIATHFDARGNANSFTSKKTAITMNILIFVLLSGLFYGMGFLVKFVPIKFISLPNKELWLNEQNKETSYKIITEFGMKIAVVSQIFLLFLYQHIYQINLEHGKLNSTYFIFALIFLVGYILWLTYKIYRFFSKKPGSGYLEM